MKKDWIAAPGDLIFVDFDPHAGREQAERGPALVLSNSFYNAKGGLAIVCPITSQVKDYPFEVPISGGSKIKGVVLADQVRTIDWKARKALRVGNAPPSVTDAVRRYVALLLNL